MGKAGLGFGVVVAIIGILAVITVPNFLNAEVHAKVPRAQAEEKQIQMALVPFFNPSHSSFDAPALLGMFVVLIPLILLLLIIYFLVQIKRGLEDLSLEMRDTREMIRASIHQPVQSVPDRSTLQPSSGQAL
ncbi:MAG: hypothetical protein ABIH23_21145 [bacterium]